MTGPSSMKPLLLGLAILIKSIVIFNDNICHIGIYIYSQVSNRYNPPVLYDVKKNRPATSSIKCTLKREQNRFYDSSNDINKEHIHIDLCKWLTTFQLLLNGAHFLHYYSKIAESLKLQGVFMKSPQIIFISSSSLIQHITKSNPGLEEKKIDVTKI